MLFTHQAARTALTISYEIAKIEVEALNVAAASVRTLKDGQREAEEAIHRHPDGDQPGCVGACRNCPLAQKRVHGEDQLGADARFRMPCTVYTVSDSLEQMQFSACLEACTR